MKYAWFKQDGGNIVFMAGASCILNGIETTEITKEQYDTYIQAREDRKTISEDEDGNLTIEY